MFYLVDNYQKGSPRFIPQLLHYCQEQNKLNLNRIKSYLHNNTNYINPRHPFALALDMFDELMIPKDLIGAYYVAREQAQGIANALGFTSDSQKGRVKGKGLNYASRNEIIVSVSYNDSLSQVLSLLSNPRGWESWSPMRILKHPFSDFSYDIPTSLQYVLYRKQRPEHFISDPKVIHVDLALMFIMYKQWQQSSYCLTDDGDYKTAPNFIGEFVSTNAIDTHVNICYINRIKNQLLDIENDQKGPVGNLGLTTGHVGFVKNDIPKTINQLIRELQKNPGSLKVLLNTLPTLTEKMSISDMLVSHGESRTPQSYLAYLLPVLDLLELVLLVSKSDPVIVNKFKPTWFREKRKWLSGGYLQVYNDEIYQYTLNKINDIEKLLYNL